MTDPHLDQIRQKRMMELQDQISSQMGPENQQQEMLKRELGQLEQMVKSRMTKQAMARYGNYKTAFPDKIMQLLLVLGQGLESGRVSVIDDNLLKEILGHLGSNKPRFNIRR